MGITSCGVMQCNALVIIVHIYTISIYIYIYIYSYTFQVSVKAQLFQYTLCFCHDIFSLKFAGCACIAYAWNIMFMFAAALCSNSAPLSMVTLIGCEPPSKFESLDTTTMLDSCFVFTCADSSGSLELFWFHVPRLARVVLHPTSMCCIRPELSKHVLQTMEQLSGFLLFSHSFYILYYMSGCHFTKGMRTYNCIWVRKRG